MSCLFVQTKSDGVFKSATQHSELLSFWIVAHHRQNPLDSTTLLRSKIDETSGSPTDNYLHFFIVFK
jgi:hypothetical protein